MLELATSNSSEIFLNMVLINELSETRVISLDPGWGTFWLPKAVWIFMSFVSHRKLST